MNYLFFSILAQIMLDRHLYGKEITLVQNKHCTAEARRAQRNDFSILRGAFRQTQGPEQSRREAAK